MTNEATLVFETELPLPFIVSNTTGIERGALLKLASPFTASSANGTSDILAGIAAQEKIVSNGQTILAVYKRGIFKMIASGSITAGNAVGSIAAWTNYVQFAPLTASGSCILGHALETVTNGQTLLVQVNVGAGGNQVS